MKRIAILTINKPSYESAIRLKDILSDYDVDIYTKNALNPNDAIGFDKIDDALEMVWGRYDAIVAIIAIGALIRKLAPYLNSKSTDPAVVAVNLELNRVVPLLSGHLGGANELASTICERVYGAINFITTATDQKGVIAFDNIAKKRGWKIANLKALARVSNALLNGKSINLFTPKSIFDTLTPSKGLELVDDIKRADVIIYPQKEVKEGIDEPLVLIPKIYLGIGCNRGTSSQKIALAVNEFANSCNFDIKDIASIASFEAKSDEAGLIEFAKELGVDIEFFDANEINSLKNIFSNSAAERFFNLKGVAEPSAILASRYKELLYPKRAYYKEITVAGAI